MSDSDHGLSRAQILKQIDASLTRLRVDHVDLYQCHRYDAETPLEETMRALSDVVRQGKARYIGFSEWSADQIAAAFALPGMERFVSSQPQYSLLWRQPEEEVIPLCREKQVSQIVWSPLAQGVLTGKYLPGAPLPAGSRATSAAMGQFIQRWTGRNTLEAVQKLKPIAAKADCTLSQFALAWVLRERVAERKALAASNESDLIDGLDVPLFGDQARLRLLVSGLHFHDAPIRLRCSSTRAASVATSSERTGPPAFQAILPPSHIR